MKISLPLLKGGSEKSLDDPNLTPEEREALIREKAQQEGEAKDKEMKETADAFTASLPRKGSYDYSKEQEEKEAQKKS